MSRLTSSSQDYLEAILELESDNQPVRSIDIAEKLEVSRASVNRAMGVLKELGHVQQERYGDVLLTVSGRNAAKSVKQRHIALKGFLTTVLGVSEEVAEGDACKMEHSVSEETLEKLNEFMRQYKNSK